MYMLRRLLMRVTDRLPAREIMGPDGEPYLERYHVGRIFGRSVYLHRFLASDPGEHLHDHPWSRSVSLVLAGRYHETRLRRIDGDDLHLRRRTLWPGRINYIRGRDFHRIDLPPGKEAWSLFVAGPRVRPWGFLRWQYVGSPQELGVDVQYRIVDARGVNGWQYRAITGAELRQAQQLRQHQLRAVD